MSVMSTLFPIGLTPSSWTLVLKDWRLATSRHAQRCITRPWNISLPIEPD